MIVIRGIKYPIVMPIACKIRLTSWLAMNLQTLWFSTVVILEKSA